MDELVTFDFLMLIFGITAIGVFILLFFVTAPYGLHFRKNWGPSIGNKLGWFIMEVPTVIIYLWLFLIGDRQTNIVAIIFLAVWMLHYGQRTFIFPLLIRGVTQMPIAIIVFGMTFNGINTYLQARWINTLSDPYPINWFLSPMFLIGMVVFIVGFIMNMQSDNIIRNLRVPGKKEYKIPYGGMFRYVSCPSYLGEITEWAGWATMTWSFPGLLFVAWTFANLAPRARSIHQWYHQKFPDYPENRKALIPFIY